MRSFFIRFKKVIIFFIVALALFKFIHWWEGRGQGFRLYKICSNLPYDSRWDVGFTDEDLTKAKDVLSQPYKYLGHGFQCYAFESQDGKYVLKFFRHQRLRLPEFVLSLPSVPFFEEWRKSRTLALSRRLDYLLRSFKTSWDGARRENALLMVQLNTGNDIFPVVAIQDLLGNVYHVDLNKCQFLLQKKAVLIKPTITSLMKEGNIEGAKECIQWIFDLFFECIKKDIQDTDGALIRKNNLGFLPEEKRAIYIDGGKLKKHVWKKKEFEKDLKRLYLLHKWLKVEHPSLAGFFEEAKRNAIKRVDEYLDSKQVQVQRVEQEEQVEKEPCS